MRWSTGGRASTNVDDRRGSGGRMAMVGGGGGIVALLVFLLSGGDIGGLFNTSGGGSVATTAEEKEQEQNIVRVLGSTEDVWNELFRANGKQYQEPTLVLFSGQVDSACGFASAAVGPFYCPSDRKMYIDLSFFTELDRVYRAPGDFAQAYVLAHEVGHHVQQLLGISTRVHNQQQQSRSEVERNRLSVRLELQADCLAGVWAHHAQKRKDNALILEPGDVEEAIRAAQAIGDDALQKRAKGYVVPDSFTHGTSAQRIAWFRHGLETGDLKAIDTFDEATWNRVNPR